VAATVIHEFAALAPDIPGWAGCALPNSQQIQHIMAQVNPSSLKIERVIVAIILIVGLTGALGVFAGSQEKLAAPGSSLEAPQPVYQIAPHSDQASGLR
jgi:hypothetical protein